MSSSNTPTIRDVATRAGVSIATVSRVLSETNGVAVSPNTRTRIESAARELGYRPNELARGLRSRHSHTLGFVSDHVGSSAHAGQLIQGVQDGAERHGMLLLALDCAGRDELRIRQTSALLDRRVDGLIYAAMDHTRLTPPAIARHTPAILLNAFDDGSHPCVVPDEQQGTHLAVGELLIHGHHAIAFVAGPENPVALTRLDAYRHVLTAAGIDPRPEWAATCSADARGGFRAGATLLDPPAAARPTAILCASDVIAMGVYQAATERGVRIPQDLSVIGVDNQELIARSLRPGLTTVALPHHEMGIRAVENLVILASAARTVAVPCRLVRRESVGPPRPRS